MLMQEGNWNVDTIRLPSLTAVKAESFGTTFLVCSILNSDKFRVWVFLLKFTCEWSGNV